MGIGNHQQNIKISELYQIVGSALTEALPCFHAITASDYASAFFRKGKARPMQEKSKEYQSDLPPSQLTGTSKEKTISNRDRDSTPNSSRGSSPPAMKNISGPSRDRTKH
ncbi:hypothetical protein GWI33_019348 [Rhynchophorus ferrugineus]|uniref:Uncharacterized protein n=1 Tax=Rhynchophorus ferrugineus TaxID=354439 RepID=A0A834HUY2_RHYFE|nr:hypothetical protein GWI33_019348 [Rhynchophorus ferrugineus]